MSSGAICSHDEVSLPAMSDRKPFCPRNHESQSGVEKSKQSAAADFLKFLYEPDNCDWCTQVRRGSLFHGCPFPHFYLSYNWLFCLYQQVSCLLKIA